jgi:hypothetical protein
MLKDLRKLGTEGMYLNSVKSIHGKPISTLYFMGKN